ncbi:flavin-containing monooxygenase FMO GS-OX-like 4 [Bidens hawaiensis]|uniref:flavin-containing monooxygenase FMO GS-OX-like 4 n=1 Tax=Bidens hawaiensis TaxID=980011 RepID=UPI00404AB4B8
MTDSLNVAVIGAGIAGLVTARELLRENHHVTVFEKSKQIGGTWVYDHRVEVDGCIPLDPNRTVVHSSLYASLRTNLPRPLMGFSDFSFEDKSYGDPRLFPCHELPMMFLAGIEEWSRKQVHSHNYRIPEPYQDQVIVVIGSGPSAADISREISTTAKEVHLSSRSSNVKVKRLDEYRNIWQHMKIERVFNNGIVEFQEGDSIVADAIIHCTGYKFCFPFLRANNMVHVDDNRVGPLYKHVFFPRLAPRLAFIGLTYNSGILFRVLELQAKWVALALSKKISSPSKDEMLVDVFKFYKEQDENGLPESHTHSLRFQFEYIDWLANQVGLHVEDRLKKTFTSLFEYYKSHPNDYRDVWVL